MPGHQQEALAALGKAADDATVVGGFCNCIASCYQKEVAIALASCGSDIRGGALVER